jgi:lipopolysaccharide transport system ATP-binding protein
MYVRLAFAVAAHLESEILIVDEVLAVGDAEFQKKCLGKMGEVSKGEGRTVLFVSHNLAAVKSLCTNTINLDNGLLVYRGDVISGIEHYLQSNQSDVHIGNYINKSVVETGIVRLDLIDKNKFARTEFGFDELITIKIKVKVGEKHLLSHLGFSIVDKNEIVIFTSELKLLLKINEQGLHQFEVNLPIKLLVPGKYRITCAMHIPNIAILEYLKYCLVFDIIETGSEFYMYENIDYCCIIVDCDWRLIL